MMKLTQQFLGIAVLTGSALLSALTQAQTIGVSIPAATHGWAGGLNFHAEQTKARLEAANARRLSGW